MLVSLFYDFREESMMACSYFLFRHSLIRLEGTSCCGIFHCVWNISTSASSINDQDCIFHFLRFIALQNYKTILSSYKNIIMPYDNIITNFKKPSLELRFKRRKGITRTRFEWKCIPNRRCSNSKRPATISFKIKFRCRK